MFFIGFDGINSRMFLHCGFYCIFTLAMIHIPHMEVDEDGKLREEWEQMPGGIMLEGGISDIYFIPVEYFDPLSDPLVDEPKP